MKPKKLIPNYLVLLPFIILTFIRNNSFYWDGIEFAWQIENKPIKYLFHKHHLLYNPFFKILYMLFKKIGINVTAHEIMTIVDILAAIAFLYICFHILKETCPDTLAAPIISTILISFSYTFAAFSRDANQYTIPVTILAYLLLRLLKKYRTNYKFKVDFIDWGLILLAILFHQISILILPALIYVQYKASSHNHSLHVFRNTVILLIVLITIYAIVYIFTEPQPNLIGFVFWALGYVRQKFWWSFTKKGGLIFIFKKTFIEGLTSNKTLFLAPNSNERKILNLHEFAVSPSDTLLANLIGWIICIAILLLFIKGIKLCETNLNYRAFSRFLILWIIPPFLFFWFFTPFQNFYRLFYLLPIMPYVCLSISKLLKFKISFYLCSILLICFILYNFLYGFIPEKDIQNNPYLVFGHNARKNTKEDTLFIFRIQKFSYQYAVYTRYFGERDVAFYWPFTAKQRKEQLSDEELKRISEETKNWITSKYRNIYVMENEDLYKRGYLKLLYICFKDNTDKLMLLDTSDFNLITKYQLGQLQFQEMIFIPSNIKDDT